MTLTVYLRHAVKKITAKNRDNWAASFSCWHAKYVTKMSPYLATDPTFRLYELSGLIQELSKSNNPLSNLFCGEGWTKRSFLGLGSPTKYLFCMVARWHLARAISSINRPYWPTSPFKLSSFVPDRLSVRLTNVDSDITLNHNIVERLALRKVPRL